MKFLLGQDWVRREMREVQSSQKACFAVDGREVLNFCSNNYLGLADDERLIKAARERFENEGFGRIDVIGPR